jgi:hypothetical protein
VQHVMRQGREGKKDQEAEPQNPQCGPERP